MSIGSEEPIHSDSEEEAPVNIVSNIPMEWYDEFNHIGYRSDGSKHIPSERPDPLDEVIRKSEDPNWWRRYYDKRDGCYKTISEEDLHTIYQIRNGGVGVDNYDHYKPMTISEYKDKIHPITNRMLSKKYFLPSKSSLYKISKIMKQLRRKRLEEEEEEEEKEPVDIWSDEFFCKPQRRRGLPAPKMALPENDESYHPPDDENPKRLLEVEGYEKLVHEREERCKDLYLAPREMRKKLPETSAELLPEIPNIEELRPFPTAEAIRYVGHTGRIRCCDVSPEGALLVSGSSDGELRIWEVLTGRCLLVVNLGDQISGENKAVTSVVFCPNAENPIILACCGKFVFIMRRPDSKIRAELPDEGTFKATDEETQKEVPEFATVNENMVSLSFTRVTEMRQVTFDRTGKFLAVLAQHRLIYIFNITRNWDFKTPITATSAYIQRVAFHPTKSHFYVATQNKILAFDLREKRKLLQLRPKVQWISSMDIHSNGNDVICGSFDGRSFWFDTELKSDPYKIFRGHNGAIRDVSYHKKFPLFAVACDDTKIDVYHATVYNDLIRLPTIVPVKELNGHIQNGVLGVLFLKWHPHQPWLFSCGADHTIRLWT